MTSQYRSKIIFFSFYSLIFSVFIYITLGLFDPALKQQFKLSCLSNVNPYITFSETFFSKMFIFLPYLYAFLSFFSSVMQNFSFGCITGFHSNKQGLSHISDCFAKSHKPHQCCNAVSHHMVFDKASLKKLPSGWAGKSWLATILSDWSYGPTVPLTE